MKEISLSKKLKVIKLFLTGLSYDEIARQVGIAKGSVVYIVYEFRDGELTVPPGMVEYVDTLRQVAVDLRRSNTTIAQVKPCLKLDAKLKELNVSSEQSEKWLDICHNIASPTVSSNQFVKGALELAQMTSESGLSYGDLIADYETKLSKAKELDKEIEEKEKQLNGVRIMHQEEKKQATRELDSITKAIATAQDNFQKQRNDLKSRLDEYISQNNLSWKKVSTVLAIIGVELSKSGLTRETIGYISERIREAGSLAREIDRLKREKRKLGSEVNKWAQAEQDYISSVDELKKINESLRKDVSENTQKLDAIIYDLRSRRSEQEALDQAISQRTHDLYMVYLIIDFLFKPDKLSDYDLDKLVSLMVCLRQNRLGIGLKQVTDVNGNVICECQVPKIYGSIKIKETDIDNVREEFAHFLTPLVKDKFVSRFDYDTALAKCEGDKHIAVVEAILKTRK